MANKMPKRGITYTRMKCLDPHAPMPDSSVFKVGEEVLVRYKTGNHTVGRIISTKCLVNKQLVDCKHLFYHSRLFSHCIPLGGQGVILARS